MPGKRSQPNPAVHDDPDNNPLEQPATGGSNAPTQSPGEDTVGVGPDDFIVDQALEKTDPETAKRAFGH